MNNREKLDRLADSLRAFRETNHTCSDHQAFTDLYNVANAAVNLASQLERQSAAEGWRPIESAPRDDDFVLLFNGYWRGVGRRQLRDPDCPYAYVDETSEFIGPNPTHWMPLPAPPSAAARRCWQEACDFPDDWHDYWPKDAAADSVSDWQDDGAEE